MKNSMLSGSFSSRNLLWTWTTNPGARGSSEAGFKTSFVTGDHSVSSSGIWQTKLVVVDV